LRWRLQALIGPLPPGRVTRIVAEDDLGHAAADGRREVGLGDDADDAGADRPAAGDADRRVFWGATDPATRRGSRPGPPRRLEPDLARGPGPRLGAADDPPLGARGGPALRPPRRPTRQHARGGGQARAGLDRERALDDESLEGERLLADRGRALERRSAARESEEQAAFLAAAEDRLDDAREERDAAARERREALRGASAELERLDAALAAIQRRAPPSEPELIAEVDVAVVCAERVGRALATALDAEDMRGDHHDVGGSG